MKNLIKRVKWVKFLNLKKIYYFKITKDSIQYWFHEHAVYHQITPKFTNVKGQVLHTVDKWKAEKSILLSHLKTHKKSVKNLSIRYDELLETLKSKIDELLSNFIVVYLNNVLRYTKDI